jgi:hypothetical protein
MNSGSWSSRKLIPSWKVRARTILILAGCAVTIVALTIWLFGFLVPWLSYHRPGAYERERVLLEQQARVDQIDDFWHGKVSLMRLAGGFGLTLLGVWCFYRVFMCFARAMDDTGHWDRLITRRLGRHDRDN